MSSTAPSAPSTSGDARPAPAHQAPAHTAPARGPQKPVVGHEHPAHPSRPGTPRLRPVVKPQDKKPRARRRAARRLPGTPATRPATAGGTDAVAPVPFASSGSFTARLGVPNFFIEKFRIPPFLLPIYQAAGTRVRRALAGARGDQRDRDRLRAQPLRLQRRRTGLDAVHPVQLAHLRRRRQRRRQEGPLQPRRRDLRRRPLPPRRRRRQEHQQGDLRLQPRRLVRAVGDAARQAHRRHARRPRRLPHRPHRRPLPRRRPRHLRAEPRPPHGEPTPQGQRRGERRRQRAPALDRHLRPGGRAGGRRQRRDHPPGRQHEAPGALRRARGRPTATPTRTRTSGASPGPTPHPSPCSRRLRSSGQTSRRPRATERPGAPRAPAASTWRRRGAARRRQPRRCTAAPAKERLFAHPAGGTPTGQAATSSCSARARRSPDTRPTTTTSPRFSACAVRRSFSRRCAPGRRSSRARSSGGSTAPTSDWRRV